jgi:hypothetical protein
MLGCLVQILLWTGDYFGQEVFYWRAEPINCYFCVLIGIGSQKVVKGEETISHQFQDIKTSTRKAIETITLILKIQ